MAPSRAGKKRYKIKLDSGRVVGPVDIDRVRKLIKKKRVKGVETAREYPDGKWVDINKIPEIASLLMAQLEGNLPKTITATVPIAPEDDLDPDKMGTTLKFGETKKLDVDAEKLKTIAAPKEQDPTKAGGMKISPQTQIREAAKREEDEAEEPTLQEAIEEDEVSEELAPTFVGSGLIEDDEDPTRVENDEDSIEENKERLVIHGGGGEVEVSIAEGFDFEQTKYKDAEFGKPNIADMETVVFQTPRGRRPPGSSDFSRNKKPTLRQHIVSILLALGLGWMGYDTFLKDEPTPTYASKPIRPSLPEFRNENNNPKVSQKVYEKALGDYLADNVIGYRKAAARLKVAASRDINNVKALAMLASSYINLIDSSNKDENYFNVISKLIELSRAKKVDLPETVIADVEYFVIVNKLEAAQNRIVEYTKTHKFGLEMFYYLAYVFYLRENLEAAARYISQIPENKVFSPKIFYLKGKIAEKFGSKDEAIIEFKKAIKFKKNHAKSYLAISSILAEKGRLSEAAPFIEAMAKNPRLLAPPDRANLFYLKAKLYQLYKKYNLALGDIEKAVRLDLDNHDYLLELYTLRARVGAKVKDVRGVARMYYFMGEGEKRLKEGKTEEALTQFMQARQANDKSALPLKKIGDMFLRMNDLVNAKLNYKKAVKLSPKSVTVWSRYIEVLIDSFEWDEAQKAMQKFRKLARAKSSIDKLAGDIYAKQGMHAQALTLYRKAMARRIIDEKVYFSYADTLRKTGKCQDAPFFYALARRFDPFNMKAIIGTAECIASTTGIPEAIDFLRDELQRAGGAKAELLTTIAELEIRQGYWEKAQIAVNEAMGTDPNFAKPWQIQAQIHLNSAEENPKLLVKALDAYKSYSDRNLSDPSGYLERYQIFIRQGKFDLAASELEKIYRLYPKYPNLHYYRGNLYHAMGNYKVAVKEFKRELANHAGNVNALVALGKSLLQADQANDALNHLSKAMNLAPRAAEPKHLAGYANYLLKNYHGAIALYKSALSIDKGNPLIFKRLGIAYRAIGDFSSAAAAFRRYLQVAPDAPDRAQFEKYL